MPESELDTLNGLVSVIVPAYNQARWIADTLESLLAQRYSEWECIVVNDGSTDDTCRMVERFIARDSRFKLLSQPNRGVSAARNLGLTAARGQYIQFLDGDDVLLPEKLWAQVSVMQSANADVSICALQVKWFRSGAVDQNERVITAPLDLGDPFWSFLTRWEVEFALPPHAFLIRTKTLTDNQSKFDSRLYSHEDWDFWLQLMAGKPKVLVSDAVLAVYRVHGHSATANRYRCWKGYLQSLAIQRERYRDVSGTGDALSIHFRRMHQMYRSSFPFRSWLIGILLTRSWFAQHCPWPIQKQLRKFCGV